VSPRQPDYTAAVEHLKRSNPKLPVLIVRVGPVPALYVGLKHNCERLYNFPVICKRRFSWLNQYALGTIA
jgi:hypothetical protein